MAESYKEPEFSHTEFSPQERSRLRRMLWYSDRSDYLWVTLRRWAVIWGLMAAAVWMFKDAIKWVGKAMVSI